MVTFSLLAILMVVGAVGVITLRQPIHAALALVGTLLALAVTYVTLQAPFLAAVQVIVYAGAIMVLFLFVLMLLNVGEEARARSLPGLRWAAYAAGVVAVVAIAATVLLDPRPPVEPDALGLALPSGGAGAIADVLFGDFLLAFHLVGVLLLTGVVAAVALVQRRAQSVHGAAAIVPKRPLPEPPSGESTAMLGGGHT